MDTRAKILTVEAAAALRPARPLAIVSGYFDVLRADHPRELISVRNRTGAAALLVAVLPLALGFLSQRARAELVAALRMVDYVVTADETEVTRIVSALGPIEWVRFEEADERRTRQLVQHVHGRQTS